MKRTTFYSTGLRATGIGAILALGLVALGCAPEKASGGSGGATSSTGGATTSSSGGAPSSGSGGRVGGTGGATTSSTGGATTGSTGGATTGSTGGATTGSTGGATTGSTGGATGGGTGGASTGGLPICASPAPADKSACNSDPSCTKNCGVNLGTGVRAQKACTCSGPAPTGMWACPSNLGACMYPAGADLTCAHLPTPLPACPPDANQTTGLLRSGTTTCTAPAAGTCGMVCGSATVNSYQDSTTARIGYCVCVAGIWQCASVNEWPPPQ